MGENKNKNMKTGDKMGGWGSKRGGDVVKITAEYEKKEKSIVEMDKKILMKTKKSSGGFIMRYFLL